MRKNHNHGTYVAFVDLVKAYDTANHELLLQILEQYGAPPKFVAAIERMYKDLVVVLKIGKETEEYCKRSESDKVTTWRQCFSSS